MNREWLTARQWAKQLSVPYTTVMTWLQRGKVAGAQKVEHPTGHYYLIPKDASRPRDGRFKDNGGKARGPQPGRKGKG